MAGTLAEEADAVTEHAKLVTLDRILEQNRDPLIVFSEPLPTLNLIHERVHEHGRPAIVFRGELTRY
jgi:hypothetical protein